MASVFFDVGVSLDGFMAGANRRPANPLGDGGVALHEWVFRTAFFRERLGLPEAGERSDEDALVRRVFERAGAYVMGRRMFDEGEVGWPEAPPFRAPVFVLTHTPREPWVRKGGTTFHFVTEGADRALALAREAAQGRDVRVSGGADTIRQCIEAGWIDDFTLHVAPMLMGEGLRLFDALVPAALRAEPVAASHSRLATHLHYRVLR